MNVCRKCGNELADDAKWCAACGASVELIGPEHGEEPTLYGLQPELVLAGRFRLERRLGAGGMGEVWLADDTSLNERVGCKVLKPELANDTRAIDNLKREVSLTRKLRHAYIVGVYDLHEWGGIHFLTMEYVEGQSLQNALAERQRPFPLEDVLRWAAQLGQALDYAHARGVLHRDVKPGNMLLTKHGNVRLADFGIARVVRDTETRLTGKETSGTLLYMSPEQLLGEKCDHRSDLYSLAASLYELLRGHPPFHTGSIPTQIQFKAPPPIEEIPDYVNAALLKGLAKKPESRYSTCAELWQDLSGRIPKPPEPKPGGEPPSGVELTVVDTEGTVYKLTRAFIRYPGGHGPRKE